MTTVHTLSHPEMQASKSTAQFFSEDIVYRNKRNGRGQVALVIQSCETDSDGEESDDETIGSKVSAGHAKVAWYPTGRTEIVPESGVCF